MLTVEQIVAKSSNVGTAKIALDLPRADDVGYVHRRRASVRRRDSTSRVPWRAACGRAKTWRPIEQATISYGHGISVTLMQLARAYSVFANDGCWCR